jgi:CDGSH-type Zn-finger protein
MEENKEISKTEVIIRPMGPVTIKGEITIIDEDGKEIHDKTIVSICRCGISKNLPYCDGAHKGQM